MHQYRYGTTGPVLPKQKPCGGCGEPFQPPSNRSKYCSEVCRRGEGLCVTCGKTFLVKRGATGKYCSQDCWYDSAEERFRPCPVCEAPFKSTWKTCSPGCGRELQKQNNPQRLAVCELDGCGKPLIDKKPKTRFCSRSCSMYARTHVRGGPTMPDGTRRPTSRGYVQVKADGRWILEHRHAMGQLLGRPLLSHETPHHVNGDRADNTVTGEMAGFRSGNLELWSSAQPPGQRVEDKVEWAVELLRLYRPDLLTNP